MRERLVGLAVVVEPPVLISETTASDGTRKWLLDGRHGQRDRDGVHPRGDRGTLCISVRSGCALACTFCSTGQQGFNRNLTVGEIIGQLWRANRRWAATREATPSVPITNVVMMGMGEPLHNFDNVVTALDLMLDDNAYGLSRRRVTVSTSGLVPGIDRLRERCPVALAVSLHAPNDALRDELVPINRKYPIRSCWLPACATSRTGAARLHHLRIRDARRRERQPRSTRASSLGSTRDVPCKINLIPFNPFPDSELPALVAGRDRTLPRSADAGWSRHDRAQDARRRHRRRLRPACGPGAGPGAPGAGNAAAATQ